MERKRNKDITKYILFTILLMLILCSCSTKPQLPDWVQGEILIILFIDIEGNEYDDFILSYSEYDFKELEIISEWLKLVHYSFNYKKIFCKDFLALIQEYPRVDLAQLNHIYYHVD